MELIGAFLIGVFVGWLFTTIGICILDARYDR